MPLQSKAWGLGILFGAQTLAVPTAIRNGADVVGGEAAPESAFAPDLVTFFNEHIVPHARRACPTYPITSTGVEKRLFTLNVHDASTGKEVRPTL